MQIEEIINFVKDNDKVIVGKNGNLDVTRYSGMISYYPEELVLVVKAGTNNKFIKDLLKENNQGLDFWFDENKTIGSTYCKGGADIRGSVLGVKVIDGNGELLNFGGEVMKNVAGYDVSRMLCGSAGKCGVITQISFKILPLTSIPDYKKPVFSISNDDLDEINAKINQIFDPLRKFQ